MAVVVLDGYDLPVFTPSCPRGVFAVDVFSRFGGRVFEYARLRWDASWIQQALIQEGQR